MRHLVNNQIERMTKILIAVYIVLVLFSLGMGGAAIYAIAHFIHKYW